MQRLCAIAVLLTPAAAQVPGNCSAQLTDATSTCTRRFQGREILLQEAMYLVRDAHLGICFGDFPECDDLQRLALTPDGDCTINVWKGSYISLRTIISSCPSPLPSRFQEKQLCTATGLVVSEYAGRIYTDVRRNNDNERLVYNITGQTIMTTSNGQCVEAVLDGAEAVHTAPCDASNKLQQWVIAANRVFITDATHATHCLSTDQALPGSMARLGPCDAEPLLSSSFVDCANLTTTYITIKTLKTGNRLSEYYTSLYANTPANNYNELFAWDKTNKMLKSASNNQCLDAFKDGNGKFQVHTYNCDVNNGNQKWNFNTNTKTLEHATHAGQCLDADPTYADRRAQMWACTPNNVNQQWSLDAFLS